MTASTDQLAGRFAQAYGAPPAGLWAAPGRVNLIGEHTDYNDGFVLPFALPLRVTVAARLRSDGKLLARSVQEPAQPLSARVGGLAPGNVPGWAAYAAGVAWVLREDGHDVPGMDLLLDGDVPTGGGLSSSAAVECSVVHALDDLLALGLSRPEQARLAQRAENDFVGVPSGIMDQMASMLGEEGHALFLDTRSLEWRSVPFDLVSAGLRLLVIDTRAEHDLRDGAYAERRSSCEAAALALGVPALRDVSVAELEEALDRLDDPVQRRRARHVVSENARVLETVRLLEAGALRDIGPLLTSSHASLRDDYEVSAPELDVAVEAALAADALGARMTGAGFGGSAIALVEEGRVDGVTDAVEQAFADRHLRAPRIFPAVPSQGATRLSGLLGA